MKMKKILALLSTFTLAFVTACGGGTAEPEPSGITENPPAQETEGENVTQELMPEEGAKLVVWESRDERAYTDAVAKEFTEKYGVEVTIEEVSPTDQLTKLGQDGPAGLAADVVLLPHDKLGQAVTSNLVLPNDHFEEKTRSSNTEAAIQGVSYNDVLYGYPRSAETYLLYYNKELVKDVPTSMEEVIEFSKTFTDKSKNRYGFMFETGNLYFAYPFLASTGGYIYGNGGTDITDIGLNSEQTQQSMEVYASLREILPVKSGDITPDIKRGLFTSGDLAMDINGPWELGGYKEALGDKLGVAPIPTISGQPAVSFSGIKAWYVNSYSQYPQAARLFADFAISKEAQLKLSALVGSVPTNNEAQEDEQIKNDEYVSAFTEQFRSSHPMPSIPEISNVWSPVGAALAEIWDNNVDIKSALDKAVSQIKDLNSGGTGE